MGTPGMDAYPPAWPFELRLGGSGPLGPVPGGKGACRVDDELYDLSLWLGSREGMGVLYEGVDLESLLVGIAYIDDRDGSFRSAL